MKVSVHVIGEDTLQPFVEEEPLLVVDDVETEDESRQGHGTSVVLGKGRTVEPFPRLSFCDR